MPSATHTSLLSVHPPYIANTSAPGAAREQPLPGSAHRTAPHSPRLSRSTAGGTAPSGADGTAAPRPPHSCTPPLQGCLLSDPRTRPGRTAAALPAVLSRGVGGWAGRGGPLLQAAGGADGAAPHRPAAPAGGEPRSRPALQAGSAPRAGKRRAGCVRARVCVQRRCAGGCVCVCVSVCARCWAGAYVLPCSACARVGGGGGGRVCVRAREVFKGGAALGWGSPRMRVHSGSGCTELARAVGWQRACMCARACATRAGCACVCTVCGAGALRPHVGTAAHSSVGLHSLRVSRCVCSVGCVPPVSAVRVFTCVWGCVPHTACPRKCTHSVMAASGSAVRSCVCSVTRGTYVCIVCPTCGNVCGAGRLHAVCTLRVLGVQTPH